MEIVRIELLSLKCTGTVPLTANNTIPPLFHEQYRLYQGGLQWSVFVLPGYLTKLSLDSDSGEVLSSKTTLPKRKWIQKVVTLAQNSLG